MRIIVLDASGHSEKDVTLEDARMEVARAILDGRAVIAVDDSSEAGSPLSDSNQITEKHKLAYILHPMAGG